ncbi:Regulator+of+RpoS [Methylocapsa aurea]|uniref:response regulator transcription factor n=1 Tax=Methylocapsa aurea TaxID=663610 RepID=UPI003D18A466
MSVDKASQTGFLPRAKVLLVEDDKELAGAIIDALAKRQYEVLHICNGSEGLSKVGEGGFEILVIDRILPEVYGINIVQELRRQNFNVPVLIISALDAVDERILGLEAGADDYLIKPFSLEELGARVDALLRRPLQSSATKLQVGPLTLDLLRRIAFRGDEKIERIHLAKAAENSGKGEILKPRFRRLLSARKRALLSSAMAGARRPS